jgi:hypothetical protein
MLAKKPAGFAHRFGFEIFEVLHELFRKIRNPKLEIRNKPGKLKFKY